MDKEIYTPEGLPEGLAGDSNSGTIDNLVAALADAGKPYEPEGLPESLRGKPNNDIIDGLLAENAGFRKTVSQLEKPPESPDGYAFEPVDAVRPYFPEMKDGASDPRLELAREAALEAGLPPRAFNDFINGVYSRMADSEAFPKPDQDVIVMDRIDPAAELAAFGQLEKLSGDDEISRRADELSAFGKAYVAQHGLPEGAEVEVEVLAQTAGGLALLSHLQKDLAERGIKPGGDTQDAGGMSDEEYARLGGSEEVDPNSPRYNPARRREYEAEIRRRFEARRREGRG